MIKLALGFLLVLLNVGCGGPETSGNSDSGPQTDGASFDASAMVCTGTLCGAANCCDQSQECISGSCIGACASGVRCGADLSVCCGAGDVCLAEQCVAPGAICLDSYDCMPGEFCEPTIGQCLPQPDPLLCEFQPSFGALAVEIEATFDQADLNEEIISIPVVADIDGDGSPEIVINMARQVDGSEWPRGRLVILDGTNASTIELGPIEHNPNAGTYGVHGRSTIALGDVNGDQLPDIIYGARPTGGPTGSGIAANRGPIVAIDYQGTLLWTSHTAAGTMTGYNINNAAVTTANLDSDPQSEVVIGGLILDHDGTVLASVGNGVNEGTNGTYSGGITAIADLDGDGISELITGDKAWKITITQGTPATAVVSEYWSSAGGDGYPAIADFDNNGTPEVVVVASGTIRVLNGQTGELWCGRGSCVIPAERTQPIALFGGGQGGPPTIADFDADGRPEIGVAGGSAYVVLDISRPNESLATFSDLAPVADAGQLFNRWRQPTRDQSSNATGSSVFDFQGDGAAEVVYADECHMRIFSGSDGTVQLELASTSATIHEYPLVVDVDGDGNSEILIVSQIAGASSNCGGMMPAVTARQGLYVYGDSNDEWVPTRQVWTQHTYHVTNSGSDGNVPTMENDNWSQAGLNNYRQNVQGDGVFNAPDLGLDLSIGLGACDSGQLLLQARVANLGALGVPPGVLVEFFSGSDVMGTLLGSAMTSISLLPGQSTIVTLMIDAPDQAQDYFARVDGDTMTGIVVECDESNNTGATTKAACDVIQ